MSWSATHARRGGGTVGGGVWETDDGRGPFIPGAAEGTSTVQVVQGRDGAWFNGGTHADSAWEGSEVDTDLGKNVP